MKSAFTVCILFILQYMYSTKPYSNTSKVDLVLSVLRLHNESGRKGGVGQMSRYVFKVI